MPKFPESDEDDSELAEERAREKAKRRTRGPYRKSSLVFTKQQ